MTYNLSLLQYCFCVFCIYTHIFIYQNVKCKQTTSKLNKLVLTRFNLSVCQPCRILTQLIVIVYIMLCWMLYFVWYKSIFLTVHSLSSLHVLNMFSSWILSYQDLHMIAFPGLIISILFLYRITYSILAHFYLVYSSFTSLTQYFTYKLQASIFSYILSTQYSVLR